MPNWRELFLAQHFAPTRKERIEARELVDAERARLAKLGGYEGIDGFRSYLLDFTLEYCEMPEVDDNIPVPPNQGWATIPENNGKEPTQPAPEKPKRRGRPKKAAANNTPAEPKQEEGPSGLPTKELEAAVDFVSPVVDDLYEYSQFVNLSNSMAIAYNGQIAAGYPINFANLSLAPNIERLKAGLKRCKDVAVIVENENQTINIFNNSFRLNIPCVNPATDLAQMFPDPKIMFFSPEEGEALREAFKVCGTLATEKGERVIEASLLLENNTCSSTNGASIIQYWHGLNCFPPSGTVLPVTFTNAVAKVDQKIVGIGGNWNAELGLLDCFTVHFENGAWLKTQCYNDRWPDLSPILDIPSKPRPVASNFFEGIETVGEFVESESGAVYIEGLFIYSHYDHLAGAEFLVGNLEDGVNVVLNYKLVKKVAPFIETIDLKTYPDKVMFFGEKLRGALMAMRGN